MSASIYLLSKREVNDDNIKSAEDMLNVFRDTFETLYGVAAVTLNVHLLRHYCHIVKSSGPLWCHSLFGFETNMGVLKRYYLGGSNVLEQIADKYVISKSQHEKISRDQALKYAINLHERNQYDGLIIQHGFSTDGIIYKSTQVSNGTEIFKSMASKPTRCIDFFLQMNDGSFGTALFYIIKQGKIFVLFNKYKAVKCNYHLTEVESTKSVLISPFESIDQKLLFLTFGTINVIAAEPNKYEKS